MFRVLYKHLLPRTTTHFNLYSVVLHHHHNPHLIPPSIHSSAATKNYTTSADIPNSLISLFSNHGFTKTQITGLISKQPMLLQFDANNALKPKLDFFFNLGVSPSKVANFIASNPVFLIRSLQNGIIPVFNFLKSYIGDDDAAILTILNRWPKLMDYNLEDLITPKIALFRDHGVTDCDIIKLFVSSPRTLGLKCDRLNEIIEMIKKVGIDPSTPRFSYAFRIMARLNKLHWEKKLAVFRELGLSESDALSMFKKNPFLFTLSLETRVIPRGAVLKILKSKGLIKEKLKVTTVLKAPEKEFLEKYVNKYQEEVPELMEAYKKGWG
ncbi:Mitochodrial transcription termination factor-related [Macleaya cordata]|uniref:Mitochodrial transcription termination factor-related n=1 Tax=Macleaya cordata TaxID=56857 RepID=A0A200Q1M5_MACCD|nr:Mitochodrial transcription termination factor-related [Macleaya cordata]